MTRHPSWSQGFPGVCARYAVAAGSALAFRAAVAAGSALAFRAAVASGAWWGVVALVALGMLLAVAFAALSAYSELVLAERFEDLLDEKDVALASYEKHVVALQSSFASALKVSLDAARQARLSERAAEEAEERARRAYQFALDQRYITEQNATGYAEMATVVMEHLHRLGGQEAVAEVSRDLKALGSSRN